MVVNKQASSIILYYDCVRRVKTKKTFGKEKRRFFVV